MTSATDRERLEILLGQCAAVERDLRALLEQCAAVERDLRAAADPDNLDDIQQREEDIREEARRIAFNLSACASVLPPR